MEGTKETTLLTWEDIYNLALKTSNLILHRVKFKKDAGIKPPIKIYGVPRGGIFAAQAIHHKLLQYFGYPASIVEEVKYADIIVDDIIDSGQTKKQFQSHYPNIPFFALIDKAALTSKYANSWIVFPWEQMMKEEGPENNIVRLLEYIGEDPSREGLEDTPKRVIKSFEKLYGGYKEDVSKYFKTFKQGACDEMVLVKGIEFYSNCEHHMLPFYGKAHIAYIPNGRVIGVSKLIRILEVYSRRLQIQERICQQVTGALEEYLQPLGAACVLEAQHHCMTSRGVEKKNSVMVTSSLTGAFKNNSKARNEFLSLIRN